jgi:hypothetical protein
VRWPGLFLLPALMNYSLWGFWRRGRLIFGLKFNSLCLLLLIPLLDTGHTIFKQVLIQEAKFAPRFLENVVIKRRKSTNSHAWLQQVVDRNGEVTEIYSIRLT